MLNQQEMAQGIWERFRPFFRMILVVAVFLLGIACALYYYGDSEQEESQLPAAQEVTFSAVDGNKH